MKYGDRCEDCDIFFCCVCRDEWYEQTGSHWMFGFHCTNGWCLDCAKNGLFKDTWSRELRVTKEKNELEEKKGY